jgi:hypothetical protein
MQTGPLALACEMIPAAATNVKVMTSNTSRRIIWQIIAIRQ